MRMGLERGPVDQREAVTTVEEEMVGSGPSGEGRSRGRAGGRQTEGEQVLTE